MSQAKLAYAQTVNHDDADQSKWRSVDADGYDQKWQQMEADGQSAHGEADFVQSFSPTSVLDAGCGTGRVAIELARRGIDVVGIDLDKPFIDQARAKAPDLDFRLDDLTTVDLFRAFDVVVMPGNVMIFVAAGTEAQIVANMADHLNSGGHLISGFQLGHGLTVGAYQQIAADSGLTLVEHWSSWDREVPTAQSNYAVLVHTTS